jgi:PTH1 family peptidyl-tRNA hydrolase
MPPRWPARAPMEAWHLIAGLGNPGREYAQTRHNVGFLVLAELARRWNVNWQTSVRFETEVARWRRRELSVLLCRPLTFMNASGEAVGALVRYYQVPQERLLVVADDADLPLGTLRLRTRGSSGGHHGLASVEQHLGSRQFARLRVGIGRTAADGREITDYVLSRFRPEELEVWGRVLPRAAAQAECWLAEGVGAAMNRFNGSVLNAETT